MRALLITPVIPSSKGNGLAMRAGMWLEALSRRFETDVAVAALFAPAADAEAFTASRARSTTMLSGTLGGRSGVPGPVPTLDDASAAALETLVAHADVVVVFRLYLAGLADGAHVARIPVVLDLDDLDWVREERMQMHEEAAAYRAYAESMLGVAMVATTASAPDAMTCADAFPRPTWMHVPNGVRPPAGPPDSPRVADIDLLFVATLGYGPNVEAARWLVAEVMPLLPDVVTAIVGAAPAPDVVALAGDHVVVAGDVPDVSPWYERARVCVVPIQAGSGTRTKVPEAWAHGRPVVSTTIGAEGIEVAGAAVIADDAPAFARACRRILTDPEFASALVEAGATRYAESHTIESAIAMANAAIDRAMGPSAPGTPPRIHP